MSIRNQIPNLLTLGNLACGAAAILAALHAPLPFGEDAPMTVAILMGIAMLCDFLDGFVARALKVDSEMGKQLDSLADMVTFGVLPGVLVYSMLSFQNNSASWVPLIGLLIPVFSAYRLAKFNLDTRQSDGFRGFPTPANAFLFLSIYLMFFWDYVPNQNGSYIFISEHLFLIGLTLVFSVLLVTDWPLLALKFKSFGVKDNLTRYILMGISLILLLTLTYKAIPLVIVSYFALSFVDHIFLKKA